MVFEPLPNWKGCAFLRAHPGRDVQWQDKLICGASLCFSKVDAGWGVGFFLGKTEAQDAWIIGNGVNVMLTAGLRRVDKPWTKNYFVGSRTHSRPTSVDELRLQSARLCPDGKKDECFQSSLKRSCALQMRRQLVLLEA